jgi:hypothetical protein
MAQYKKYISLLGDREEDLKEETTTGTTPYASKFPWPYG